MGGADLERNNHSVWLAGAMAAPLAHFSGGSWLTLLVAGTIIGALNHLLPHRQQTGKGVGILKTIAVTLLLACLLPASSLYWPGKWSESVVPAGILALSLWASGRNPERVCGFLLPLMLLILLPVGAAAIRSGQIQWAEPGDMTLELLLIPILLLPGILNNGNIGKWYWGILAFGVLVGVMVCAVLSPGIASTLNDPFRQMGRTLTLGAASRFEPVISMFMTFAWFSLFALVLSWTGKGRWIAAPAAYALCFLHSDWIRLTAVALTVIVWVYPMISVLKNFPKKSEKSA